MNPKYLKFLAASNTMIGRAQMSRRLGALSRAMLQLKCASRLFSIASKTALQ